MHESPDTLWLSLLDEFQRLERQAEKILDPVTFQFISSGPNSGLGVQVYLDAFRRLRLIPHPLPPGGDSDLSVTLFDTTYPTPVMIAPTGFIGRVHPDAELALAGAARARSVPMWCSTYTAKALESVQEALAGTPWWYQLYWSGNRDLTRELLRSAEALGSSGIAVTVDTGPIPMRPAAMIAGFGEQLASDPVQRVRYPDPSGASAAGARTLSARSPQDAMLDAAALEWICESTTLPVLAKGVLSGDSARRLLDCGVRGVVVSNHGGQLLDSAIASIDALPEVREAVGNDVPVLLDSGIRTGSDVVKALALGANAVLVGRPCLMGLAVAGEEGVGRVLDDLLWDLRVVLAGLGGGSVAELEPTMVRREP
jgi:lactate 2-monooxygenase